LAAKPYPPLLHWTSIGALIGTVLVSPVAWFLGSPFDHSLRSLSLLLYTIPITYLIGLPPAFMTGLACRFIFSQTMPTLAKDICIVLIGAISSTYLIWILLLYEFSRGELAWELLYFNVLFVIVGGLSTITTLFITRHETNRHEAQST
jgi:hypothetical protein